MKIAIINDLHWGFKRSNKVFEEHIASFHERFVNYIVQKEIGVVVIPGDMFDVRGNCNLVTLETLKKRFLNRLRDNNIQCYISPGNHDCSYKNSISNNSVSLLLNEYENITVVNKPTVINLTDSSTFLLVPWIAKDEEKEFLDLIDSASLQTSICIGHFEFKGFLYQKGIVAEDGMEVNTFTPKFDMILSGHYHSKSSKGNVHYLGSQVDFTWADYDEKKFFHVLDTTTKELTSVENTDRIHHKVFYDEGVVTEDVLKELDSIDFKDKIIKVIVTNRKNMVLFDMFVDRIYKQNPYDVSVIDESIIVIKKELKVDTSMLLKNTLEIINDVLTETPLEGYNIDSIRKTMFDLYQEVN